MRKIITYSEKIILTFVLVFSASNLFAQVIQSDDFNSASLNASVWTFINPIGDGSYAMEGHNSGNASINITAPASSGHDLWSNGVTVPRIMQPAANTDFEIEVKFESLLNTGFQQQGIIVEQEEGHLLRYEMYSDGNIIRVFAAILNNPSGLAPSVFVNKNIASPLPPYYLRVKRTGDEWFLSYSLDGGNWFNAMPGENRLNYIMDVNSVGAYAGNSIATNHKAKIDYFFNTEFPIIPEDSALPKVSVYPNNNIITTDDPVELDVRVDNISGLFASSITLEIDNTLLKFIDIANGSFYESNAGGSSILYQSFPENNFSADSIVVDQSILGRDSVSGSGILLKLNVKPLRAGVAAIKIKSLTLRDIFNNEIEVNSDNAQIEINSPIVNAKVYLEGPFSGTAMNSNLPELGIMPQEQPYNISPWNYDGFEKVKPEFFDLHPEIVDWVLVELRTGTAENSTIAQRAAFINENGSLVDLDGTGKVSFFVQPAVQYYLVIKHRNHLAVMSRIPVDVNYTSALFDFTNDINNSFGTEAMSEVAAGVYAMYAGDGNNDGLITGTDFNLFNPLFRTAAEGYLNVDWNLDGIITGTDFNVFNPNFRNAKETRVP